MPDKPWNRAIGSVLPISAWEDPQVSTHITARIDSFQSPPPDITREVGCQMHVPLHLISLGWSSQSVLQRQFKRVENMMDLIQSPLFSQHQVSYRKENHRPPNRLMLIWLFKPPGSRILSLVTSWVSSKTSQTPVRHYL